jgi:hypothetical protein
MDLYLQGCITMSFLLAGVFFLRYWRDTRDRLFLCFALAFAILGLNRGILAAFSPVNEENYQLYVIRLIAFLIIAAAIVDKNLHKKPSQPRNPTDT